MRLGRLCHRNAQLIPGRALSVVEAWGEDVSPGKLSSFPQAVQPQPEETAVFSWVRWPSKATRDEGMKSMACPFDGSRM